MILDVFIGMKLCPLLRTSCQGLVQDAYNRVFTYDFVVEQSKQRAFLLTLPVKFVKFSQASLDT